jgi:hypothetical protein
MMVHFGKRPNAGVPKKINEPIFTKSADAKGGNGNSDRGGSSCICGSEEENEGMLIIDATCVPEDIRFLHDATTLDEARRKMEMIIDKIFERMPEVNSIPRTYRRMARKRILGGI